MTQEEFKRRHSPNWQRLESMVESLDVGDRKKIVSLEDIIDLSEFDREYRRICRHLSLARQRLYSVDLVDYLNRLTLRANRHFYGQRRHYLPTVIRFVLGGFPKLVRSHAGAVWASTALFVLPALAVSVALSVEPDLIHAVFNADQIRSFEEMYEPGSDYRTREREADTDLAMFGFYILNNVGIGFRTFAGGIVFGVGSIFFIVFNGLVLGAVATHLHGIGYGETFFPFVAGHSSLELTAIVLAGASGLHLGWSLIAPGRLRRIDALLQAASSSIRIIAGVAGMLVLAACIEAFWSPRAISGTIRIAVGGVLWILTLGYFFLAGRDE
jgi:uncharacterized membrane protein SpoIIM required for sporulation